MNAPIRDPGKSILPYLMAAVAVAKADRCKSKVELRAAMKKRGYADEQIDIAIDAWSKHN